MLLLTNIKFLFNIFTTHDVNIRSCDLLINTDNMTLLSSINETPSYRYCIYTCVHNEGN